MQQFHHQIQEEISRDRGSHNPSRRFRGYRVGFWVIARLGRDYQSQIMFRVRYRLVVDLLQIAGRVILPRDVITRDFNTSRDGEYLGCPP
jgi:hypothetical protein